MADKEVITAITQAMTWLHNDTSNAYESVVQSYEAEIARLREENTQLREQIARTQDRIFGLIS